MRILVTGEKSYVGINLKKWLSQWHHIYEIDFISLKDEKWKSLDFSVYDVLFHVAALVHKKEQQEMESLYYKVNRDLTVELANKAKKEGIKQFIFMSSISVYGLDGDLNKNVIIDNNTPCVPSSFYGKSKLEAEIQINKLHDENFKIAIVRAPMIYGAHCPGNYSRLRKIALKTPLFPSIVNQRSMIFIDNLSEFIRLLIEGKSEGVFFPQNKEYINTAELVQLIANQNSRKIISLKSLAYGVKLIGKEMRIVNKVFGSLVIDSSLSEHFEFDYCIADLPKSIEICEKNYKNRC
ncbi:MULTISPECIES: NAD-dependent epimerase/dehydratase family protein [Bacillaceae]|uniref:NAD-dependent epimerase/dehydratase family protein n=1 Tax=Bacillaceae TaxID=186817 RepID=UPI000BF2EF1F|nr:MULTISPECIES: NAD-dependent epimerase/dehydratase family protein [Bacillaceae]PEZ83310.1 UDP-glucose 4-epimerase [Bacillus sp. AFS017274]